MRKFKAIFALTIAVMLISSFSLAETIRSGDTKNSTKPFNPTRIVTKTANYTLTTSDSEVDFNSATDVTATLPAIESSAYPGKKTYKIKNVNRSGRVILAPATGNTIGGETQRVLSYYGAYIILSAGPNKDWSVDFESPLVLEDYKVGSAAKFAAQIATANTTFTASDCGKTIAVATDSLTMTLPVAQAGCDFTFVNTGAAGNNILDIAANAADAFYGPIYTSTTGTWATTTLVTSSTGSTLSNTKATSKKGDKCIISSPGATIWSILCFGTWTTK